jgi:hypothetical protein
MNISCILNDIGYIYRNLIVNKMKNKLNLILVILSVFIMISCKDKSTYSKIDKSPKVAESSVHKIVINEFMDAAGYTYINVSEGSETYWMAIPNTTVKKGETYYYAGGMQMKDFESKELERTFDVIIFAEGISTSGETASKPKAKNPHSEGDHNPETTEVISIELPEGGVSIGELYKNKNDFNKKEIIVKGKVVKVNKNILDKNWIHIVDGTNFEGKKDLTITTNELAQLGAIVTFKATVVLDKDFGAGYVYNLLLENGEIIK